MTGNEFWQCAECGREELPVVGSENAGDWRHSEGGRIRRIGANLKPLPCKKCGGEMVLMSITSVVVAKGGETQP